MVSNYTSLQIDHSGTEASLSLSPLPSVCPFIHQNRWKLKEFSHFWVSLTTLSVFDVSVINATHTTELQVNP